jgi:DNA-binding NarL/FixJ family response regulator
MKLPGAATPRPPLVPAKRKLATRPASQTQDPRKSTRIVIVDDHPVLRKGLGRIIDSNDGFVVCGEAGEAIDGMALIRREKPDLVIADIGLPGASGIELTKNIRAEFPDMPVLILSMHEESLYAMRALRAGATGYIVKQEAIEKIADAVREVLNGRRYLSPAISQQLSDSSNQETGMRNATRIAELTDRELEILELIGKGREVREIAEQLSLSPKTVETHRTHIKEKLNLKNARQVARFAVQWAAEQSRQRGHRQL